MVLPGSDRVPRARPYSGTNQTSPCLFAYAPITLYGSPFHDSSAKTKISYSPGALLNSTIGPTTPTQQRQQAITSYRFRLFPVRSPLLGESRLISFPPATEMFHFTGSSAYDHYSHGSVFYRRWLPYSEIPG